MHLMVMPKIREIVKNWFFWLLIITGIAIAIRSFPAWTNATWGCDFGIYYGLTNSFVETKELFNIYTGWGNSYQYFPVLYVITGITHFITGIDVLIIMPKIIPIIGGLTVPIIYFIVLELIKDKRIALISAALLSIATFHVYQTSHAAPLTVGHFLMLLSLYFFIKYMKKKTYTTPLLLSTGLLVLSHHFTTYFYIVSITFILFANMLAKHRTDKNDMWNLAYVSCASSLAFGYWAFIAKPVFYGFMQGNMSLSSYQIIGLYYVFLFGGFIALLMKNKHFQNVLPIYRNKTFSLKTKVSVFFIILVVASVYASINGVPGVYAKITPLALFYSLPMLLFISLSLSGFSGLKKTRGGILIMGWIFALSASFFYSLLSGKLLPDRHLEYLIVPLCIPAAISIVEIIEGLNGLNVKNLFLNPSVLPKLTHHHIKYMLAIVVVACMGISNIMAIYPTIDALDTIDERVSQPCISALGWMNGNVSASSVVASDHRISMLLWAEDFNITMGKTNLTWTANNWTACLSELKELNITHIFIDDIMEEIVVNIDVGKYYHMSNESYDKFTMKPFELIYRNATVNNLGEEMHWAEVYAINISHIENYSTI